MKFRLRGNQEQYLDDTEYWTQGTGNAQDLKLPKPVKGVIDWPEKDLLELAAYAEARADAISGPGDMDWTEIRSLRSLAKRIRSELPKGVTPLKAQNEGKRTNKQRAKEILDEVRACLTRSGHHPSVGCKPYQHIEHALDALLSERNKEKK